LNRELKEDPIKLKRLQGFIIGVIICSLAAGGIAHASPTTRALQARFNNIRVVVDGTEIHPRDAAGNRVEPFIIDGTTYLPVRAVGDAVGKAVYWDGPPFTVYLGNMGGRLEHPTLRIADAVNIGARISTSGDLTDNYGNRYGTAVNVRQFETLLDMRYSRFKGTIYVPQGYSGNERAQFVIEGDGRVLYSSPDMTRTSRPVHIDVDVTGVNHFRMIITVGSNTNVTRLGDAGFYQ